MSDYSELKQYVDLISDETKKDGMWLLKCSQDIQKLNAYFAQITAGTNLNSAKQVETYLRNAQKDVLHAAKALLAASEAGKAWSAEIGPTKEKVLRRR